MVLPKYKQELNKMREELKKHRKEIAPFKFEYTEPCLDWYTVKKVEIQPYDYYYFKLERRYSRSWWIVGMYPIHDPDYQWKEVTLGEIDKADLKKFIKWAEDIKNKGSCLIEIKAISADFNIIKEIKKVLGVNTNEKQFKNITFAKR